MSDIQRYRPNPDSMTAPYKNDKGDYVLHKDHLKAIEQLEDERDLYHSLSIEHGQELVSCSRRIEELKANILTLERENIDLIENEMELKAEVEYCHSARKQSDHVIKSLEAELSDCRELLDFKRDDITQINKEIERLRGRLNMQEVHFQGLLGDGWLPIDTAPKDGTYVLVWQPDMLIPDHTVVCWDEDEEWWHCCDGKNPDIPLRGHNPTHWQPLPEPPSEDL